MRGLRLGLSLTGGAAAFNPASLFTASQGGYYDPSPTSTGVAADAAVAQLNDLSGNGNHATQATAGSKPILRQSGSNYYLELDGTDDFMAFPTGLLTGWTSGTFIFAALCNPAGFNGPVLGEFGTDAAVADVYPYSGDGHVYQGTLSTARKDCGDPGDMTQWHIGDFRSAAGSFIASFDGTDYFTTSTNTVGDGTAPLLGRAVTGGSLYFKGFIGRIILINRVLTGADLANARTWVGAGSGMVL
jgi:hypothetical protein